MLEWHIGTIIGILIERKGLTIKAVAGRARVAPYHLGQIIKKGKTSTATLEKLAKVLDVSPVDIYAAVAKQMNSQSHQTLRGTEHLSNEQQEFFRELEEAFKKGKLGDLIITNTRNIIYTFTDSGSPVNLEEKEKLGTRPKLLRP